MSIIFSHISALEILRLNGSGEVHLAPITQSPQLQSCAQANEAVSTIHPELIQTLSQPIHTIVYRQDKHSISNNLAPHVKSERFAPHCVQEIVQAFPRNVQLHSKFASAPVNLSGEHLYVSSPELCFQQLSSVLRLEELILVGLELCGTYSLCKGSEFGFVNRPPLTTPAKLSAHINAADSTKGIKKARRALKYITPNSASPRESSLTMLLCLPYKMGGCNFNLPVLNQQITLGKRSQTVSDKHIYVCDLYWPDKKVAVEYDSDQFHTGPTRIEKDSQRRNELSFKDISVVTFSRNKVSNLHEFNKTARILGKHLGKRVNPRREDFLEKQRQLRSLVL